MRNELTVEGQKTDPAENSIKEANTENNNTIWGFWWVHIKIKNKTLENIDSFA